MELLEKIITCNEDEVDKIIDEAIQEANNNSEKVEKLGFLNYGKDNSLFKGFIPLDTRIKYSSINIEDYGMNSTDFFYEFAHFIRKYDIHDKSAMVYSLERFLIDYFGYFDNKDIDRETIFNDIAWQTTTTDKEYFDALAQNKIGDLKGKGVAECTERSAVAQQILSLFGTESYYCMGATNVRNLSGGHCFNIVKRKNDYAILDYSIPVPSFRPDGSVRNYYPFIGEISNEEFLDFTNNKELKSFDDYHYTNGNKKTLTGNQRAYVVGEFEIKKENSSDKKK